MNPAVLHIHAQTEWHEPAFVVGNRLGLTALRDAIDRALNRGDARCEVMPQDGECFDLFVIMDDADWQSSSWDRAALPYTAEYAMEQRTDAVWPLQRVASEKGE